MTARRTSAAKRAENWPDSTYGVSVTPILELTGTPFRFWLLYMPGKVYYSTMQNQGFVAHAG